MAMRYVSTYFSPNRGAAEVIIGFIDKCQTSLDIAVYAITYDRIVEALIRAHQRGVRVRVLLDRSQAGSRYSDDEVLEEAGIPVLRDTRSGAMHNKFVIGDNKSVGTGSFNWTKNADERNAENFVIIRIRYVVADYQDEFNSLWELNQR